MFKWLSYIRIIFLLMCITKELNVVNSAGDGDDNRCVLAEEDTDDRGIFLSFYILLIKQFH